MKCSWFCTRCLFEDSAGGHGCEESGRAGAGSGEPHEWRQQGQRSGWRLWPGDSTETERCEKQSKAPHTMNVLLRTWVWKRFTLFLCPVATCAITAKNPPAAQIALSLKLVNFTDEFLSSTFFLRTIVLIWWTTWCHTTCTMWMRY